MSLFLCPSFQRSLHSLIPPVPLPCEMVLCQHSALLLDQHKILGIVLPNLVWLHEGTGLTYSVGLIVGLIFTITGINIIFRNCNKHGLIRYLTPPLFSLMPMCFQNAAFPAATCCSARRRFQSSLTHLGDAGMIRAGINIWIQVAWMSKLSYCTVFIRLSSNLKQYGLLLL